MNKIQEFLTQLRKVYTEESFINLVVNSGLKPIGSWEHFIQILNQEWTPEDIKPGVKAYKSNHPITVIGLANDNFALGGRNGNSYECYSDNYNVNATTVARHFNSWGYKKTVN